MCFFFVGRVGKSSSGRAPEPLDGQSQTILGCPLGEIATRLKGFWVHWVALGLRFEGVGVPLGGLGPHFGGARHHLGSFRLHLGGVGDWG